MLCGQASSVVRGIRMRVVAALVFIALMCGALVVKVSAPQRGHFDLRDLGALMRGVVEVRADEFAPLAFTPPPPVAPAPPAETQLTIVLAGDTGLNGSFQPVRAGFGIKQGMQIAWSEATPGVAGLIDGDINFANLETVVTDRNDLTASLKRFGFRTHPDGVRHLLRLGFNVFSTANNHSMDYGLEGGRETLKHLDAIGVAHAGLGLSRSGARGPRLVAARGRLVAFGAVGIGGSGYGSLGDGEARPGQLTPGDMNEVAAALAGSAADYKVMSVHYGTEFEVTTAESDRARFGRALAAGADMVVGHHQHVVAGVEMVDGKPVFYGLGNFLHWGTQDMSRHDLCHDYGLVARVHLSGLPGERLTVRAIEAIPVTGMHKAPRAMGVVDAGERVQAINYLARQFGANGVRFAVQADGTGLYCAAGAERLAGAVGARCRVGVGSSEPEPALAERIRGACAKRVVRMVEDEAGEFELLGFEDPVPGVTPQ